MMKKTQILRELLKKPGPIVSPGVYDGYSARLVEAMGFKTAATTGSGLANALLVQPDIGIMGLLENVDACRHLMIGTPGSVPRALAWSVGLLAVFAPLAVRKYRKAS